MPKMRPEMIAIASGCCMADPWPMPSASGISARMAANVVIAIGRMRLIPATIRRSSLASSSRYSE